MKCWKDFLRIALCCTAYMGCSMVGKGRLMHSYESFDIQLGDFTWPMWTRASLIIQLCSKLLLHVMVGRWANTILNDRLTQRPRKYYESSNKRTWPWLVFEFCFMRIGYVRRGSNIRQPGVLPFPTFIWNWIDFNWNVAGKPRMATKRSKWRYGFRKSEGEKWK